MDNIKVYLQYPWSFPDSPYYKYLISYPPNGISYLNTQSQKGVITNKKLFFFSGFLKNIVRKGFSIYPIPNAHKTKSNDFYQIIHCAHCLSKNNSPWVMDLEGFWQLVVGKKNKSSLNKVKKILLDPSCKKIMPWTKKCEKDLITNFPELKNKVKLVYPAVNPSVLKHKPHKNIVLFFVGRYFYSKGGYHILEVMNRLTKKYNNVVAKFVSVVPPNIKAKYKSNKKIQIFDLMPHSEVLKLFNSSDIFVYPGYSDSFGFAFLEAMSFGLPIVTITGCSRDELIKDGLNGLIVKEPGWDKYVDNKYIPPDNFTENIISAFVDKVSFLIDNPKILRKISKNNILEIKSGRFSIKKRNEELKKIYFASLK